MLILIIEVTIVIAILIAKESFMMRLSLIGLLVLLTSACATSPTGKSFVKIFPDSQMSQMGAAAFTSMKKSQKVDQSPNSNRYVQCIVDALIPELLVEDKRVYGNKARMHRTSWEVSVFQEETPNAFALPGGKIGVHTGMFKVASSTDMLASVIGHEIGHVWSEHGNARMSNQFLGNTALQLTAILGGTDTQQKQEVLGLLGVATQVGGLSFSRQHESESDDIGLILMARAGFDPRASVTVWQNMSRLSQGRKPPEFLSTHPSNQTRINDLNRKMPKALQLYQAAKAQGKRPNCRL